MVKTYENHNMTHHLKQIYSERQSKNEYSWMNVIAGRKFPSKRLETYNVDTPKRKKNKFVRVCEEIAVLGTRFYKAKRLNKNMRRITFDDLTGFLPAKIKPSTSINTDIITSK